MLGGFGKVERVLTYIKAMLLPTGLLCRLTVPKGDPFKDLATIMFSSGSTGEPKGVMLSHHNVISNLEAIGQILGAAPEDRVMGVLPFFHAFGFTGTLFMPLVLGLGAVYHPNPLDAKSIGGLIKHVTATERAWADFIRRGPSAMPGWNDPAAVEAHADQHRMRADETLAGLLADYDEVAGRTDQLVAELPDLDASQPLPEAPWFPPGARWSARRTLLHVIAETAQHAGHADIIRESLDGAKTMG